MRSIVGQVVFQAGDVEYQWRDVLLSAALWGRWEEIEREARRGLDALRRAEEAEESPVDDDAVQAAADEFRYSRNLLTAEEMEAWLGSWELDVDAWMTWIVTDHLRRTLPDEGAGPGPEPDPDEVEAATWAEAVFSTALIRMAHQLTERVAVSLKMRESAAPEEGADDAAAPAGTGEAPPALLATVDRLGLDASREDALARLAHLSGLERDFEAFRRSVVDEASLASRVKFRQTDWTRVGIRMLRFGSEDAAREALISVRDDGSDFGEVAAESGARLVEGTFSLESFEAGTRDHLLSAPVGGLLGPVRSGEEWTLFAVEGKQLPSLDDPEIRKRAEDDLLRNLVGREVDNRVSWRWGR